MAGPKVGDSAPDFALAGTSGSFRLSDHRGERVVLLFYPGDDTPVCTRQFCSYRDRAEDLDGLDATVVGISSNSLESHRSFTLRNSLTVPLLADEDGAVAKSYGVWRGPLRTKRAVVIVDEEGIVRHRHDHLLGIDFQDVDELAAALAALPAVKPS
jgi:thioredoxin-dependent peroxiredoxin